MVKFCYPGPVQKRTMREKNGIFIYLLLTCVSILCKTDMEKVAVFPVPDWALKQNKHHNSFINCASHCAYIAISQSQNHPWVDSSLSFSHLVSGKVERSENHIEECDFHKLTKEWDISTKFLILFNKQNTCQGQIKITLAQSTIVVKVG